LFAFQILFDWKWVLQGIVSSFIIAFGCLGNLVKKQADQGPIFRTFFPLNILEKRFFKTFSAENSIFSQHFWGKIFRGIFRGTFPGKKCTKNRPQMSL
jgi:hypothetical protein